MKTLDEVIADLERGLFVQESALYYLKEYRDECNNIVNVHDDYIRLRDEMVEELNKMNPPLTWDELKTMEGKPVWIEIKKKPSLNGWRLIRSFNGAFMTTLAATCYQREFNYKTMGTEFGKTWQAYRKERE